VALDPAASPGDVLVIYDGAGRLLSRFGRHRFTASFGAAVVPVTSDLVGELKAGARAVVFDASEEPAIPLYDYGMKGSAAAVDAFVRCVERVQPFGESLM
jgi:hypothetical protein